jgi:glycosyltransferase involved in cell wall biosynthesis
VAADQVPSVLAGAVAGIASLRRTSLMEGARPSKLHATMACARPVLYSGAGEGAALVREADAGVVVDPEDPIRLAAAARALAADGPRAEQMGLNGRRYVQEHLAWGSLVETWLHDLQRALAPRGAR